MGVVRLRHGGLEIERNVYYVAISGLTTGWDNVVMVDIVVSLNRRGCPIVDQRPSTS